MTSYTILYSKISKKLKIDRIAQTVDYLKSEYPSSEGIILGDFTVYNETWITSYVTSDLLFLTTYQPSYRFSSRLGNQSMQ